MNKDQIILLCLISFLILMGAGGMSLNRKNQEIHELSEKVSHLEKTLTSMKNNLTTLEEDLEYTIHRIENDIRMIYAELYYSSGDNH